MWKSEPKAKGKRKKVKVGTLRRHRFRALLAFCLLPFAFFLPACRRDMQDQPKAIAYRESKFFKDGNASRQLVEGTVPRGFLRQDRAFYFGKKSTPSAQPSPALTQTAGPQVSSTNPAALYPDDVETFPIPISKTDTHPADGHPQLFGCWLGCPHGVSLWIADDWLCVDLCCTAGARQRTRPPCPA